MRRYETRIEDDVLSVETDDGWLEIGAMDTLVELFGGETYVIEYDEREQAVSWLDTNADGTLQIDVRETLADLSFDAEFVNHLEQTTNDEETPEGYPKRAAFFVDMLTDIWDAKGDL